MIIQCEQCQTKFRLDDSKVKDSGVKVRCARCKYVFAVSKEQQEQTPLTDSGVIFDQNAVLIDEAQPFDPFASDLETGSTNLEEEYDFGSPSVAENTLDKSITTVDSSLFDLPEEEPVPVAVTGAEFSHFAPDTDQKPELDADESPAPGSETDFDGYDFGDLPETAESSAEGSAPFSDFDGTSPDTAASSDSPIQLSDFAGSSASLEIDEGSESAAESTSDQSFNLGEIDFGEDLESLSSLQVNPDEIKGGLDFDFGHLDEPQETTSTYASGGGAAWVAPAQAAPVQAKSAGSEELAPLPIASRRKQNPLLTMLLSLAAVFGMGALIYMGSGPSQDTSSTPAPESAKITLSAMDAAFINNKKAGELLVIYASAVNNMETPQAAIQIMGMVYGDKDKIVAGKTAFCGNTFTKEQLASMSLDTIEAAMANQFGSALANLEVGPGKSIPCMVVISKLPRDAQNYGAVLAGSQPVTPKQK